MPDRKDMPKGELYCGRNIWFFDKDKNFIGEAEWTRNCGTAINMAMQSLITGRSMEGIPDNAEYITGLGRGYRVIRHNDAIWLSTELDSNYNEEW